MSANYDLISKITIDVNKPIVKQDGYGVLLIVGPAPTTPAVGVTIPEVGSYKSLAEVTAMGWVATGSTPDPVGVAAAVAFSQKNKPSRIVIAPIKTTEETVEGEPTIVAEEPVTTVERALNSGISWYICTVAGVADTKYQAIAEFIETTEKMFWYTDTNVLANNAAKVTGSLNRTHAIFGLISNTDTVGTMPANNKYIATALAAQVLGYPAGSETAAFKELVGITAGKYSANDIAKFVSANVTYYNPMGSKNVTLGGKVLGGEWVDVIRFTDWLHNDMQVRIVDTFIENPKVPFNDAGITLIENQMLASLKAGQDAGGICEDEPDADGNIVPSFSTSVPTSASLTPEEKASRSLSGFTFVAKLAGTIHFAEIHGTLTVQL